jgi:hypothetical protein
LVKKILLFIFLVTLTTTAFAQSARREDVESAFLFHFISYTEWDDNQTEYFVCIPDNASLRQTAEQSLGGKVVNNRKIEVVDRTEGCHILVSENIPNGQTTTLTIGPLARGALIEFRQIGNKVKFAANMDKIKESKVKISSQVLKLAILDKKI